MKNIFLFGCSGSIGKQTIEVIKQHQDLFNLVGVSVHTNLTYLKEIVKEFNLKYVLISDPKSYLDYNYSKYNDIEKVIKESKADYVVNAVVGSAGLKITLKTLELGIDLGLANKESLVVAGNLVNTLLKKSKSKLYPIDSEHSAIFQCLKGEKKSQIKNIIITASGGPFKDLSLKELENVKKEDALKHPTWNMGAKISIDSATLVNKGLEIIEAFYLFKVPLRKIKVLIHPQSIVHSLVEFIDGSIKAQLGTPSMLVPIQYALSYPNRITLTNYETDLSLSKLEFRKVDLKRFEAIKLAYDVLRKQGIMPLVFNQANEEAVKAFLNDEINFGQITEVIKYCVEETTNIKEIDLGIIESSMLKASFLAREYIKKLKSKI
ncbi:MAG: 1-deoxy-D-xylulose-5-phosphate reductoisomerase [Bacillales bacterium]|jgi:1-deoxy-D-xylulose-5-phosphate reductoisomerase|nr:1-deoxy-D-xylulose-5-phosphate reductoisomerase [Bacillales bacterium]